jgi:hypothetical protein
MICPAAADFNGDTVLDISDPIAIIGHLFLGAERQLESTVFCRD